MSRRCADLCLLCVAATLAVASAKAATLTWDGGGADSDIDTAANWNPDQAPGTGDSLIFDGNTRTLPQLVVALTVGSVSFNSTAAAFTIGGNKTLTINSGGVANNSADTQTLTVAVKLNASQIWDTASGGLTMSGAISGSGNGITKSGSGTLTLSGSSDNSFTGATSVNAGTLLLNKTAGKDAFNGALVIGDGVGGANADVARLLAANQIPDAKIVTVNSSGLFDLNSFSETIHTLNLDGGSVSLGSGGNTLTINTALNVNAGTLSSGNGNVTMSSATVSMTSGSINTGSGTLTLGGDINGSASSSTATIAGNLNLGTANRNFTVADGSAATDMGISAIITGTGALTKAGAGLLELSAANTYSGNTTVEAGILSIKHNSALGTVAGSTAVDSGATLQIDGSGLLITEAITALAGNGDSNGGALRNLANNNAWAGTITLDGDARINSDNGTLTISGNVLTGNGEDLTVGGTGNMTISGIIGSGNGQLIKDGTGTLTLSGANTYTGATTISTGTLALGASNRIVDTVSMTISGGATFDLAGFNETIGALSGAGNVNLGSGTLTAGNGTDTTLSGVISGSGSFVKAGAGVLTLGGANSFTGTTTVNAGTLSIGADNNLGSAPASATAGSLTLNGGTLQSTAALTLNANRGLSLGTSGGTINASSGTLSYGGILAGSGALTKSGTGTLNLGGANTYSGATAINAGAIGVQHNAALGTTVATTVADGAAIHIDGNGLTIAERISSIQGTGVSSGGALRNLGGDNTWSGAITIADDTRINSDSGTLTISSNINNDGSGKHLTVGGAGNTTLDGVFGGGTGHLIKEGAGTLTLGNANTFTGAATINAGVVRIQNNASLGAGSGKTSIADGGAVHVDGSGLIITEEITSLIGTGVSETGALRNLANNNTWTGDITLGTGGGQINADSGNLIISGVISGSGKSLTKGGAGTVTLNGDNSFNGGTTIRGGTLAVGANERLSNSGAVTVDTGGTFDLAGFSETIGALSGAGSIALGSGALTAGDSSDTTFSGVISGAGSLTKTGSGTLVLSGNNTYTGSTTISDGTLRLGAASVISDSSAVSVAGGAVFDLNGQNETVGSLAGASNVTLGAGNLTTGGLNTSTTHSGVISGSGGVTKTGTGTLILAGSNTYTGGTAINAGLLRINGSTPSSVFTVNNGGTISGVGAVGDMILASGGTVSPGASPGTLNTGSQTWAGGANYVWEISKATGSPGSSSGWDLLNIGGSLTINASAGSKFNIQLTSLTLGGESGQASGFDSSQNYAWTIATASGGIAGFDATKFYLDASAFQNGLGGGTFGISQSGNDVSLTFSAVPEPHEYALAIGVGLLGFAVWRRRRHLWT